MIKIDTIKKIYDCYTQIAECHKLIQQLDEKIEKAKEEGSFDDIFNKGRALDVGIPDFNSTSRRIVGISLDLGYDVINNAIERYTKELKQLETIAKIEISQNNTDELIKQYVEERLNK